MNPSSYSELSWPARLGVALGSILAVVAGLAVASVLFVVLLAAGLGFGGWLWWQSRRLARQARAAESAIIEGEYTIETDRPEQPEPARKLEKPVLEQRPKRPISPTDWTGPASSRDP